METSSLGSPTGSARHDLRGDRRAARATRGQHAVHPAAGGQLADHGRRAAAHRRHRRAAVPGRAQRADGRPGRGGHLLSGDVRRDPGGGPGARVHDDDVGTASPQPLGEERVVRALGVQRADERDGGHRQPARRIAENGNRRDRRAADPVTLSPKQTAAQSASPPSGHCPTPGETVRGERSRQTRYGGCRCSAGRGICGGRVGRTRTVAVTAEHAGVVGVPSSGCARRGGPCRARQKSRGQRSQSSSRSLSWPGASRGSQWLAPAIWA